MNQNSTAQPPLSRPTGVEIIGTGCSVPDKVMTNDLR